MADSRKRVSCCERELEKAVAANPSMSSFQAQDGDLWTCPKCKLIWVHICDEAEGCMWTLLPKATQTGKPWKVSDGR